MKKLVVLFAIVSFVITGNSQELTRIDFDKLVHDFGEIKEAEGPVTCKFEFKNIGKNPLIIKEVKTSCGCTTPNWTKEPVKPGKSGFVTAVFDPKNRQEQFTKTITVTTNTSPNHTYLRIKGYIIQKPKTILDDYPTVLGNLRFKARHLALGEIKSTSIDTAVIEMYNPTNERIMLNFIEAPNYILFEKMPTLILPMQRGQVQIFYNATQKNELGYIYDRIILKTDDVQMPNKEIIVVANIKQDFSNLSEEEMKNTAKLVFEETEHNFGVVKRGEVVEHDFKFKNEGKYTLVIYHIKSSCGCTGSTIGKRQIEPGETGIIKVKFNSKGKKGMVVNTLTVFSNDPSKPQSVLKIMSNVVVEEAAESSK